MSFAKEDLLHEGERIDDLEVSGFRIIQNPSFFCFGMDAVLLSTFAGTTPKDKVMDLGTGTGIIPLLLLAKGKCASADGLELQEDVAEMAGRSVLLNEVSDRCRIISGDICEAEKLFPKGGYDAVTSNPPYIARENGLLNDLSQKKNIARHEIMVTLSDVVRAAAHLLKPGGTFSMVHKPFRIPEIMETMRKYKLEPKRMQLVQPYQSKEPNMVLLEAVKGGNPFLTVHPTLVVYEEGGGYTKELLQWYGKV